MAYDIMEVELVFEDLDERTQKSIHQLNYEFNNMRAGRANVHILDNVTVEYYGVDTPLNQVANVTVPEARMIMITVWDASILKKVEKAIIDANIGITPNNDGKNIRLIFPEPTEERRRALAKDIKACAEKAKVAVRNIRRDAMTEIKNLEKSKVITEDMQKNYEADVDKKINARIEEIDKLAQAKEAEVLKV
ncbi:MAG: ribosome recycling factor [Clostridiales bacterium]|jgi:ribosome recycling factor|nr:ribosome recycling factor [Clostridiales bacterium]MDY4654624.1 ribosome recycling factor [Eubacteriales bacterium]